MKDDDSDLLMSDIIGLLQDEEDFSEMLAGGLDWLEGHILAAKAKAAEFPLRAVRKRGPTVLDEEPRLFIGTCHSFKGAEADVVIVFPDLSPQGYTQWVTGHRDSIVRLMYVAFTRAREELVLCGAATGAAAW
jgi:ATP-dependent exoDNAse (exonuclease V) beta subunit